MRRKPNRPVQYSGHSLVFPFERDAGDIRKKIEAGGNEGHRCTREEYPRLRRRECTPKSSVHQRELEKSHYLGSDKASSVKLDPERQNPLHRAKNISNLHSSVLPIPWRRWPPRAGPLCAVHSASSATPRERSRTACRAAARSRRGSCPAGRSGRAAPRESASL